MAETGVTGSCQEHPERSGTPCARCGTFRCGECLGVDGVCVACAHRGGVARVPEPHETEGFGRRALARLLDIITGQLAGVFAGVVAAVSLALLEAAGVARAGWLERFSGGGTGFNLLVGLAGALVGHTVMTWLSGASLGKAMLGMRVVTVSGERVGFGASLIRELAYYIDSLFFGLVGKAAMDSSVLKQRHGDRWGGTIVVRRAAVAGTVWGGTGRLLSALAVGFAAEVLTLSTFFVVSAA